MSSDLWKSTKRAIKGVIEPGLIQLRKREREKALSESKPHVTSARIARDLGKLPLHEKGVLLVHSSLKSLGFVEGGAQAVVDALVSGLVEAQGITVMLPAYSIDGTMYATLKSGRAFDVRTTPSNLGALPEAFRRHPKARRSVHPTHSFAAIGPLAEFLTSEHHMEPKSFGPRSPMGKMLKKPAQLLGIGTTLGTVTFYHCLEDMEDFPLHVYAPDGPFDVPCTTASGIEIIRSLNAHQPGELPARRIDHPQGGAAVRALYTSRMEERAGLTWHRIGEAPSWLIDAAAFYREIKTLMSHDVTIYASEAQIARFNNRAKGAY